MKRGAAQHAVTNDVTLLCSATRLNPDAKSPAGADIRFVDEWIARDYIALGYCVVRVPVLTPEERLAFVLERLSEQGLILQLDGAD